MVSGLLIFPTYQTEQDTIGGSLVSVTWQSVRAPCASVIQLKLSNLASLLYNPWLRNHINISINLNCRIYLESIDMRRVQAVATKLRVVELYKKGVSKRHIVSTLKNEGADNRRHRVDYWIDYQFNIQFSFFL